MDENKCIDQIQEIRAKNNVGWMDILRIALKSDPKRTKEILREIIKHDEEITAIDKILLGE